MRTFAEPRTVIQVFARAPVPGATKTRLIPRLGAEQAARLHERMIRHALESAIAADVGPVQLWCDPGGSHPFFLECGREYPLTLHAQVGRTLGDRLCHAHRCALAAGSRVLLIGTDCPALSSRHLRTAEHALGARPAVIIPAEDGGYVLLGLARRCDEAFAAVDWGSARVCAQTVARLRAACLPACVLDALWDVDREEDYLRLARELPELAAGRTGPDRRSAPGAARPVTSAIARNRQTPDAGRHGSLLDPDRDR